MLVRTPSKSAMSLTREAAPAGSGATARIAAKASLQPMRPRQAQTRQAVVIRFHMTAIVVASG